jgi:DNA-binding MarR family transcriptional regulator
MTEGSWYETAPIPQLMLDARGSYGNLVRQALAEAGFDDVPDQGGFVLAGLASTEFTPQAEAVAGLRRSKQRSSQLIDTLVLRGYLERRSDPEDRRRMEVRLTERGRVASAAIQAAADTIDAELANRLTPEELHGLRAGLAALAEIRKQWDDGHV